VLGNFISDWLILAEEMNLIELRLEPLAIEPLGSVGTVSFSDSMMTYIWFLSALVFVQAGYVGKDVESILYKLLMVRIWNYLFCSQHKSCAGMCCIGQGFICPAFTEDWQGMFFGLFTVITGSRIQCPSRSTGNCLHRWVSHHQMQSGTV
jgi:hypothetical protein